MERRLLDVCIVEFEPTHYQGVIEVHNAIYPGYRTTLEELRFEDETWDHSRYFFRRWVALDQDGEVRGYGEASHLVSVFHPRRFRVHVDVHPRWQGQGIGRQLYDHIMKELHLRQAEELLTHVREDMEAGLRFATRRGFRERQRSWESVLDLAAFDPRPFREYVERSREVEITTLAEEWRRTRDCERRVHELQTSLMRDVPLPGRYTPMSLDLFREWVLKAPGFLPEAYFIAKVDERYIGQCVLERELGLEGVVVHGLTGVLPEFRGRGIAMALKVTALEWAKRAGFKEVRTWNDSTNRGIIAINEKLGFQRRPAWITLVKRLEA